MLSQAFFVRAVVGFSAIGLLAGCGGSPSASAAAAGAAASTTTVRAGSSSPSSGGTPAPAQPTASGSAAPPTNDAGRAGMPSAGTPAAHGGSGGAQHGGSGAGGVSTGGVAAAGSSSPAAPLMRCPAGPFQAPVPAAVSVTRVDNLPPLDAFNDNGNTRTNIEGPVWIAGKLYVSEFPFTPAPKSRILAFDPTTKQVSIALATASSNGLAVDAMGALIATDHGIGAIVRMTFPLSMPEVLVGTFDGKRFDSPNDLAVAADGSIYFSDPDYQAPSDHPQAKTRLYRLAPGAKDATVIDDMRSQPNGVTLSADEHTLYVAGSDGIYGYPVAASGEVSASARTRINGFNGNADGMGMDCAGNLYAATGQRIAVLSPAGMEIGSIPVPQAESVTNVAFGGPDQRTLFITSMGSGMQRGVFRAELNVPGLPY